MIHTLASILVGVTLTIFLLACALWLCVESCQ